MAKLQKPIGDQNGEVTFQFVKFTMKGSDSSLQKSLETIAAALMQGNAVPATPRLRGSLKQIESTIAEEPEQDSSEEVLDTDPVEETAPPRAATPRKPPKVKTYSILTDVRLDDVSPTFKEFATEKNPPKDLTKYLVIAYWFKHHKKIPNISVEHFYTAYRDMKWPVPTDPTGPIRELRANRDQRLSKGSEPGTSVINQIGENTVDALGKAA